MQQNSCRVDLNVFSVELAGKGLKSCVRVRGTIYENAKESYCKDYEVIKRRNL